MELVIREACEKDGAAISQLSREELGYEYPPEETAKRLRLLLNRPGHCILVAELDGEVAGYLHLNDYEVLYAPPMKNILGLAVGAAYKRQGIGRALLEAGEVWAKETGAAGIRLNSGESRTGAHSFYRACGYAGEKRQLNLKKMFETAHGPVGNNTAISGACHPTGGARTASFR